MDRAEKYLLILKSIFHDNEDVMNKIEDYEIEDLKYSYGAGIRYMLNEREKINMRVDVGFSPWGTYPYLRISEAF